VLGYLADKYGCESQQVLNHSVGRVLNTQLIVGLKKSAQGWQFKGQTINQHERDALLVFWIY
jgi:hypothetical protein